MPGDIGKWRGVARGRHSQAIAETRQTVDSWRYLSRPQHRRDLTCIDPAAIRRCPRKEGALGRSAGAA